MVTKHNQKIIRGLIKWIFWKLGLTIAGDLFAANK